MKAHMTAQIAALALLPAALHAQTTLIFEADFNASTAVTGTPGTGLTTAEANADATNLDAGTSLGSWTITGTANPGAIVANAGQTDNAFVFDQNVSGGTANRARGAFASSVDLSSGEGLIFSIDFYASRQANGVREVRLSLDNAANTKAYVVMFDLDTTKNFDWLNTANQKNGGGANGNGVGGLGATTGPNTGFNNPAIDEHLDQGSGTMSRLTITIPPGVNNTTAAGSTGALATIDWDGDGLIEPGDGDVENVDFGPRQTGVTELSNFELFYGGSGTRGAWVDNIEVSKVDANNTLPPVIESFTVAPASILASRDVRFEWDTNSAVTVTLDDDAGSPTLNLDPSGNTTVAVDENDLPVTFTLTATNPNAPMGSETVTSMVQVTSRGITESPTLMACWPFDGDLTETIVGWRTEEVLGPDGFDDIGFEADVPAATSARVTQSLAFTPDNIDDYLVTNFGHVLGTSPRSVSYWVKSLTGALDGSAVFSLGRDTVGGAFISNINIDGATTMSFRNSAGMTTDPGVVAADTWTHIALVYAGVDGSIFGNTTIYVNGTRYNILGFFNGNEANTTAGAMEIGRDRTRAGNVDQVNYANSLRVSELVFYKGELTPAQVASLAGGSDPKMLDGGATPQISPIDLAITDIVVTDVADPDPDTVAISYQATEGTVLELRSSTDATDFSNVVFSNLYSSGASNTTTPTADLATETENFFLLRDD